MKNDSRHTNQASPDTLYARLFAHLYNPIMHGPEQGYLLEKRRKLLQRAKGKVLEVGAGTGINLPLYPQEAEVLAIEPSAAMLNYASKAGPFEASIRLMQAGIGDAEVAQARPAGGYDFIVTTLVLCTIPDLEAAIRLMSSWLKPGGQLLVMEHIHDERPSARWLQNAIDGGHEQPEALQRLLLQWQAV